MIAAGNNSRHQLIVDSNAETASSCEIVSPPLPVQSINPDNLKCFSIGGEHCVFITNDGKVFASGSDLSFQIGTSQSTIYSNQLKEIKFNKKQIFGPNNAVRWLHCGSLYTMYITDDSAIYCSNNCKDRKLEMHKFENSRPIYVTGSTMAPIVIDSNGDFFIFSENPKTKPIHIHLPEPVISISRCDDTLNNTFTSIVAITKSGVAYGNGSLNNNNQNYEQFDPIPSLNGIKAKSASGYVAHCIVTAEDGSIYAYGNNSRGQLGNGCTENATEFVKVELPDGKKVVSAAVGNTNSYFVTDDGKLFACGANIHGQLMTDEPNRINNATPIESCLKNEVRGVWSGNAAAFALVDHAPPTNPCLSLL